jgi:geranylgeranyl diphosphate synthase type II
MTRAPAATQTFRLQDYLEVRRVRVNRYLDELLPAADPAANNAGRPATIEAAMRYSLSAGGKRLRPILAIAAAEAVGGAVSPALLAVAASLELIHTYSLIHDDLPAMDNDDLRRGRPTNHKVFGEAAAILAGDGLLTMAFELLSRQEVARAVPSRRLLRVIQEIAVASGAQGMVGGQLLDLQAEGATAMDEAGLERIHRLMTGALIRASVLSGALVGGATARVLTAVGRYGDAVGLAFQIMDDILDVEGTAAELGKAVRNDRSKGKSTYPAVLGLEASKRKLAAAIEQAVASMAGLGAAAEPLRAIAVYVASRRV